MPAPPPRRHWRVTVISAAADQAVNVNGIACTGKGSCVAVGGYITSGTGSAFIAVEQHGVWRRAFQPGLPGKAARPAASVLYAVTCTGPGSCEAIGHYYRKNGQLLPMSVAESHGRWRRATVIGLAPHATPGPASELDGIACTHPGSCVVVGHYITGGYASWAADTAVEVRGRWHRATPLRLPSRAWQLSQLDSVSRVPAGKPGTFVLRPAIDAAACSQSGACAVVGSYQNESADSQALTAISG